MTEVTSGGTSRRVLLAGTGAAGVAAVAAGCTTYGTSSPGSGSGASPAPTGPVAKVSDIPVGGGKIFPDKGVVVTQPAAGTIKVYTDICTHQGCQVNRVADGFIDCPCHGSEFAIATGVPTSASLARQPLAEKPFTVTSDGVVTLT
jgi:Rieske Fe-S protein